MTSDTLLAKKASPHQGMLSASSRRPSIQLNRNLKQFLIGNRQNLAGAIIVAVLLFLAVFGETIAPHDPFAVDIAESKLLSPSSHWMGTDELGRYVFSRVMTGTVFLFKSLFLCSVSQ